MLFKKSYFYVIGLTLLLSLVFLGIKTLHHEWRSAYTILFQSGNYKVNLLDLQLRNLLEGVYRPLIASREKGLPERRFYISQKAQNTLMEDMPANIKKWQKAFLRYPKGQLRRVKAKQRGDSPANWAFHRKSWRVKLPRSSLIDNTRVFNFVVPQDDEVNDFLPYYMARMAGVLAPRSNLVEFFVNDESQGIYHEIIHIDESFLRNNKLMPVNIYKGEQLNREKQLAIASNLFDNPGLWTKISNFNQRPETDFSDLGYALELIRLAETSESALDRLKHVARYDDWARFSALQTLLQSWHNTLNANQRLISDPWKGSVRPVIHNTASLEQTWYGHEDTFDIFLDSGAPHPLLYLYQGSSDFLVKKYQILYEFVNNELLLKAVRYLEEIFPAVKWSFTRNNYRYEKIYTDHVLAGPVNLSHSLATMTTSKGMKNEWWKRIGTLRWLHGTLKEKLTDLPSAHWVDNKQTSGLVIGGPIPLSQMTLEFSPEQKLPKSVAWDADGDGFLSDKDILIPFRVKGNHLELDAVWMANRVTSNRKFSAGSPIVNVYGGHHLTPVPTQFWLVSEGELNPISVSAANFLTGEMFLLSSGEVLGNTPSKRNIPVVEKQQIPVEVWSNTKIIEGIHQMDGRVRILPGTTLRMKKGASLIFRNQVQIKGKLENPVKIVSDTPKDLWGTVALHGPNTAGSVLSHLMIENGSGATIGNIHYIGMLSVHEAKNVKFENLILRKNRKFDDMMHIVYSDDIHLQNCVFEEAFSDGLDVDLSTVLIQGCRFSDSGNDAVDLMGSKVLIMKSELSRSGDKGVSVGEGSDAVIYNSILNQNMIGVESKDGSVAYVVNSSLIKNGRQINAYKKNWRYGTGGRVVIDKSVFTSLDNSIKSDKKSDIKIFDSTFGIGFGKKDRQVSIDSLSTDSGERKAASPDYQPIVFEILQSWGIQGNSERRGVFK